MLLVCAATARELLSALPEDTPLDGWLLDTFTADGSKKAWLTPVTTVLFGLATVAIWIIPAGNEMVFGGMYIDSPACKAMKAILNIGVFIVMLQSASWTESDEVAVRKGEFYELMLVTRSGIQREEVSSCTCGAWPHYAAYDPGHRQKRRKDRKSVV